MDTELSKPALLKKGLRHTLSFTHTIHLLILSKPALLKKGLRLGIGRYFINRDLIKSKPALLKKGLRLNFFFNCFQRFFVVETCPT